MAKNMTIVFFPNEGVGHVNSCIGLAQFLYQRGHRIVFVVDSVWSGKLTKYGFIEELIPNTKPKEYNIPGEAVAQRLKQSGVLSDKCSFEKMQAIGDQFNNVSNFLYEVLENDLFYKSIIHKYNADVYIIEQLIGSPAILNSGKPWVYMTTLNPLFVYDDERVPPAMSGYPANGDPKNWNEFKDVLIKLKRNPEINRRIVELGYPPLKDDFFLSFSPTVNLYTFPEELDYSDISPLPSNWYRIDLKLRDKEEEFQVPEKFSKDQSKKLIYLSMGSMGSIDVDLMKNLVEILSKSKYYFIVSKGILGDKYELADNMWGQNSVSQTKVLPFVDLVITHGGNNTVIETFSFGKPMIVMPLFADQFDNAQRIHEKGFGIRLDPYNCSEQLLEAIEKLLNDNQLKERLSVASQRFKNSNTLLKVSELIENLV